MENKWSYKLYDILKKKMENKIEYDCSTNCRESEQIAYSTVM